ncbi:uncharacterized protein LOC9632381 [Selaginella moellendorffii]|uniref:uncharacterized protein LOC9632381 n=1 Tax=Selaginella moellendorffii TaxID=88036 RepID=UPI000D1CB23B|nr:uncharacterized protein LOC9632381 [Selaginella moellendorffii]|eukprot:XP_024521076.1 uncharacterized protein LOC9632381 [Selaginella moellendorffii]
MAVSVQGSALGQLRLGSAIVTPKGSKLCFTSLRKFSPKAALAEKPAPTKTGSWSWRHNNSSLKINFVEQSSVGDKCLLLLPTVSDVSTTEEWKAVSQDIVTKDSSWRSVIVDWPGFGLSDRPAIDYTADTLEKFLVDFVMAQDGPLGSTTAPVIAGGGHAATIAAKAIAGGKINARALVAVAPTWAGPLPIVFGQSPDAVSKYGFLRGALRAPAVGWALYNALVSSRSNIRKQYESHVYSESSNVTDAIVDSRLALTKLPGARYAPAAFLTGLLDPVKSREEFVELFGALDGKVPALVMVSTASPRRSRAEMEALRDAKGVAKLVEIPGALLAHEEFPGRVASELYEFLSNL